MKPSAMPASVESSAARGVALRTRSATNAHAELDDARARTSRSSPACHATRAGSAAPAAFASGLRRQHHQEHVREERAPC